MLLETLLKLPNDSPQLHLRSDVYGKSGAADLLREVMGLANADAGKGSRYILIGVSRDQNGQLEFKGLNKKALAEFQRYPAQVLKYMEPDLKVTPSVADLQGNMVAVLEIPQAVNSPYMMKVDASKELQRGACWTLEGGVFRPAQRADLDRMFSFAIKTQEKKADTSVLRVGQVEDPNNKSISLEIPGKAIPPSIVAAERIKKQIDAKKVVEQNNVEDTQIGRLMNARLSGSDSDFSGQGVDTLVEQYNAVMERYSSHDYYYYFETQAVRLNLAVVNKGPELLEDVNLMLMLPRAEQFRVSDRLQPEPGNSRSVQESELLGYPKVKIFDKAVQVKASIAELQPDQVVQAFEQDLRIAVDPALAGRTIVAKYSLQAPALEQPETGELLLKFAK
ncbi:MAG: AlbA family DNA-binding domain-containing protein [Gammaproteobacteria bacterium]